MKTLTSSIIISVLALGLTASSAWAEAPAAPSNIDPNNHAALATYYEGLAKDVAARLEILQHELEAYEDHPYAYGRRGQDVSSHLHANIREYQKELSEDLEQVDLHKKMTANGHVQLLNKARARIDVNGSVVR